MNWRADQKLDENSENTNFNPAAAPYRGFSDADQIDKYPGQIEGLVYISGNLAMNKQTAFNGVLVVGGTMSNTDKVTLSYSATARDYPPPGFSEGALMRILPGTWRRVAAP
jgi:hypothetical protein